VAKPAGGTDVTLYSLYQKCRYEVSEPQWGGGGNTGWNWLRILCAMAELQNLGATGRQPVLPSAVPVLTVPGALTATQACSYRYETLFQPPITANRGYSKLEEYARYGSRIRTGTAMNSRQEGVPSPCQLTQGRDYGRGPTRSLSAKHIIRYELRGQGICCGPCHEGTTTAAKLKQYRKDGPSLWVLWAP
jgi:hypothetical protein